MKIICALLSMTLIQASQAQTVKSIDERVKRLEELIRDQSMDNKDERFIKLEALMRDQSMELKEQSIQMECMKRTISEQKTEIKELSTQLADIRNSTCFGDDKFSDEQPPPSDKHRFVELQSKPLKLSGLPWKKEKTPHSRKRDQVPFSRALGMKTAFYAFMSKWENGPGNHHTLIFDSVKTNDNNGYNQFTGAFNVPATGTYVFTFSIRMYDEHYCAYEIIKNADVVGTFVTEHNNDPEQNTLTGTVVINANPGNVVYVRTHSTFHCTGDIASDVNGRSTFSGWSL